MPGSVMPRFYSHEAEGTAEMRGRPWRFFPGMCYNG